MRKSYLALVFLVFYPLLVAQQSLNNDSIIKLVKAGLSDDLIVATINASPGSYDASADGIIALKSAGASDKVVSAVVVKAAIPATGAVTTAPPTIPAGGPASPPTAQPAQAKTGASAPELEPTANANGPASGQKLYHGRIQPGDRVVIAPMGGFESYFAAAIREKRVPITLTLDRESAQYFIVSTETEWRGFVAGSSASADWNSTGGHYGSASSASSTRGLESSIMLIDARSKDVVWAYEVHKSSHGALLFGTLAARGQQSLAEACAKHLKEFMEKGK
jgi:hypothetical protein